MTRASFAMWCVLVIGCDRPTLTIGETCGLNSDCASPLVCGLERCRTQCVDSRDCAAGLRCLSLPSGNVCQLPDEAMCALASECTAPLTCLFGTCTTECATDRDCPPSSSCMPDPDNGDALACIEAIAESCIYNSDCPDPDHICAPDRRCRHECEDSSDCDPLRECRDYRCYPIDDAGPPP
jgi:hypothetical protein